MRIPPVPTTEDPVTHDPENGSSGRAIVEIPASDKPTRVTIRCPLQRTTLTPLEDALVDEMRGFHTATLGEVRKLGNRMQWGVGSIIIGLIAVTLFAVAGVLERHGVDSVRASQAAVEVLKPVIVAPSRSTDEAKPVESPTDPHAHQW